MKLEITGGLNDVKSVLDGTLPSDFIIPRKDDIIYFKNKRYVVYQIIIDYDYDKISIWVKDCKGS